MHFQRRSLRFHFLPAFLSLALALITASGSLRAEDEWDGVERIVAIGDVHGDYDQFARLLLSAQLIDAKDHWTGGKAHLVQTGDVPDRGPDTRRIFDLLMRLDREAQKAGGYVHALIGNHEAMNMYGDLRYVVAGEYEAFRTPRSGDLRQRFYEQQVETLERSPPESGLPVFDQAYRRKWEAEHPLGFVEHRLAFAPDGKYGKWIRSHNAIIRINDSIFLHGGLGPTYAGRPIAEINKQVQTELSDFSKLPDGIVMDPQGPLWYRGLAQGEEAPLRDHLERVLGRLGAKRMVVGHTPQPGAVLSRFGGRVLLIDVGLSAVYGGNLACLVIEKGQTYALHRGEKLLLPSDAASDEYLAYLKRAASLDPAPSPLLGVIAALQGGLKPASAAVE
jgi:Calcineurin-like phosphoesterase